MSEKCICELYRECTDDPDKEVTVGYNAVAVNEEKVSGEEFVRRADLVCTGTRIFLKQEEARRTLSIDIEADEARMSLSALHLQCEYFAQGQMGS